MDPLRKYLIIFIIAIANVSCGDSSSIIHATGKVEVYETFPKNEPGNKMVGVLSPEESASVLATKYSKEFMFYRIKLADGKVGYVMFGDNFTVEKK